MRRLSLFTNYVDLGRGKADGRRGRVAYKLPLCPRDELDLLSQIAVQAFLNQEKPDAVMLAAAKVGGIHANNKYPAQFIYENLQIQNNIIHGSHLAEIQNLLFLGSSCIYPKYAPQPLKEEYLLTSSLESTNQWYALAKITGVKLIEAARKVYGYNYVSLMPTNLYGENDNFDPMISHVLCWFVI